MGAGELEIFARIALPLAVRGIASGLMLAFARAMGEFGATLMIAGNLPGRTQTLSIAVYEAVQAGDDARALWLTLIVSVVCVGVLVASGRLLRARH
jgi:molybdate transport system permease protein